MKTIDVVAIGVAAISVMLTIGTYAQIGKPVSSDEPKAEAVDAAGNLHVPASYRTTYQLLGSWAVAADQGKGPNELHVVYASPGTIAAYRSEGRFPDGS